MSEVRIEVVSSYHDRKAIDAAVGRAFEASGVGRTLLATADPDRLVVVKPNWIQQSHQHQPDVWETVITHPVLIMATLERLADLMRGIGTIALCDAPHTDADFDLIVDRGGLRSRLDDLRQRWPELGLELIDLRREVWVTKDDVVVVRRPNPHDPRGYVRCDLGRDSLFYGHRGEGHFYGADYDTTELNRHHRGEVHEYLLSGTAMRADLFVNLPKLKTHKKTGMTCCLKNLVGINGDKNWLPHHCAGSPASGGDEYPEYGARTRLEQRLKRLAHRGALAVPRGGPWLLRQLRRGGKQVLGDSDTTIRNGNWHGNDTCWRMALDLNRALRYGNPDGTLRDGGPAKPYLAIVDGIVAGDGNGPIAPDRVEAGVLISGTNPAAVDATCARLMGYSPGELPIVAHAFADHRWPIHDGALDELTVIDDRSGSTVPLRDVAPARAGGFRPHFGWDRLGSGAFDGS